MIIPLIHLSQRSSRYTMQRPTDGCPNGEQFGGLFRRNRHLRAHWKPIYACHAMPCTSINHPNEISLHILNQRTKHQKSICLIHPHSSTVLVVSVNGVQETKYINIPKMPFWLVVSTLWKIIISQLGWLFPIYGKIKNVPNHQPAIIYCISTTPHLARCCWVTPLPPFAWSRLWRRSHFLQRPIRRPAALAAGGCRAKGLFRSRKKRPVEGIPSLEIGRTYICDMGNPPQVAIIYVYI